MQADEARFIDRSTMGLIITDDHVIKDGPVPPGAAKGVGFARRKLGMQECVHRARKSGARVLSLHTTDMAKASCIETLSRRTFCSAASMRAVKRLPQTAQNTGKNR